MACLLSGMLGPIDWASYGVLMAPLFLLLAYQFWRESAPPPLWIGLGLAFLLADLVWDPLESVQLKEKTLGIIGLGGIGREVARMAAGIGMEVIAWNRTPRADAGLAVVEIDALLARADVISLHLALTDETRGFLDAHRIARSKPGLILVNAARGALVDEAALIDGLRSGHIRHAGLDVFHAEPLRPDHPLAETENVTLTSHAGFRTLEASMTLLRRAIDIVRRIAAQPPSAHAAP